MIDPDHVPKEPSKMYEGFEWVTMDLTDEKQVRGSLMTGVILILIIKSLKRYMSYFRITMWKMTRLCSGSIIRFLFSIGIQSLNST